MKDDGLLAVLQLELTDIIVQDSHSATFGCMKLNKVPNLPRETGFAESSFEMFECNTGGMGSTWFNS